MTNFDDPKDFENDFNEAGDSLNKNYLGTKCHYCDSECPYPDIPVCDSHRFCIHCRGVVGTTEITYCVTLGDPPQHARCIVKKTHETIKIDGNDSIRISRKYFDYLNLCRLIVEPDLSVDEKTNRYTAVLMHQKLVVDMNLDEKFIHMAKMESVAVEASTTIRKDRVKIQKDLKERDDERFKAALTKRVETTTVKVKPVTGEAAKKAGRAKLTDEEKAIAGYKKILPHLTDEQIIGIYKQAKGGGVN